MTNPDALVLEGGSMRCAFTAGILDTFMALNYRPFTRMIGVSSGAMALSYYCSHQPKSFIQVARHLVTDSGFIDFKSAFSAQGIMNLEYLQKFVNRNYPLDELQAEQRCGNLDIRIVATHFENGAPIYLSPQVGKWQRFLLASATLPFITHGKVKVEGTMMFVGGYADPIPYRHAILQGSKRILVIRTRPSTARVDQSYVDWFGSYWHRDHPELARLFKQGHDHYNALAEELASASPDSEVQWTQIAPPEMLASDGYSVTQDDLDRDYRLGLELGLDYLRRVAANQED